MRKKVSSGLRLGGRPISGSENIPLSPTPESLALLAAFRAIAANDVYAMAPKESVVRGYEYYRQQRLHHYVWNQSRTALTAQVQGTRLYSVVFALSDEFLEASCDCPAWDPVWLCKHVMCACFTTKHLLSPETFTVPAWQETKLPTLRAELLGHSPKAAWKLEVASTGCLTRDLPARGRPMKSLSMFGTHTLGSSSTGTACRFQGDGSLASARTGTSPQWILVFRVWGRSVASLSQVSGEPLSDRADVWQGIYSAPMGPIGQVPEQDGDRPRWKRDQGPRGFSRQRSTP